MSQVPEQSFTLAQYRNTFRKRFEFTAITVLGSDANGTHFQWDDARGERHFGVISDLFTGILRRGVESMTIALGGTSVTADVALSPALTVDIADYLVFTTVQESTAIQLAAQAHVSYGELTSLSNLRLRFARAPRTIVAESNATTSTISPEPDTGHAHNWPVSTVQLLNTGVAAFTATVSWMIIRA